MTQEMEVAGYSDEYTVPPGAGSVTVVVTPTNQAYVRLEHRTGAGDWVYGQSAFLRNADALIQTGLTAEDSSVRIKVFGGIGAVDLAFSAV